MKYRPDIDGLRTIAVMGVVLYHAGVKSLSGGFVGVDVFFVISGFLITKTILNEYNENANFCFTRFYIRRARRLFPAMASVLIVSFIFSFLLFSPEKMRDFAGSSIYSIFSLSNIFFWWQTGYFDADSVTKPLLHTWSLSIEEQFYLIWPAILILFLSRIGKNSALTLLIILSLSSLAISQYWINKSPSAAFFLLPSRLFELGIGGILVWLIQYKVKSNAALELILLIGIVLIAWPMLTYTELTPFPGVNALVPCLGTALTIYAGTAKNIGLLLRNPVSVLIGKASYSIYLVHWPLIVFYVYFINRELNAIETCIIIATSIILGWIQYVYIEERFRHENKNGSWSRPAFGLGCALVALLIMLPISNIWADGGAKWRIPNHRITKTNLEYYEEQNRLFCNNINPSISTKDITCQNFRNKKKDLIVWGDSHALHLIGGLSKTYPNHNIYVIHRNGCTPQSGFSGYTQQFKNKAEIKKCIQHNLRTLRIITSHSPSDVIITSFKRDTPELVAPAINAIIDNLTSAQHNVIYLADFIKPGTDLINCTNKPNYIISDKQITEKCTGVRKIIEKELGYNAKLKNLVNNFIDINSSQCPSEDCLFTLKNKPLFRDEHHLTYLGAEYFLPRLKLIIPID
ncbi:acyltransferase family protein [Pseudochrobactrum sp. MP213Fo]|uniref:acyltransferase family protein n=1 Tax=Pseudochrobactrum sp. MP213Fo TaxID=3022250 RepID=UPI003BA17FCE